MFTDLVKSSLPTVNSKFEDTCSFTLLSLIGAFSLGQAVSSSDGILLLSVKNG